MTGFARLGCIGLGQMGGAIALRLMQAGHPLTVFDTDGDAVARLVDTGAQAAASPAAVADVADTILVCLPSPEVSRVVAHDVAEGGAVRNYIETSTIGPEAARDIAQAMAARGIRMLDMPVSGGPSAAMAGTLSMIVSGPPDAVTELRPLLAAIGSGIFVVGAEAGMAQLAKLANNALSLVGMALAAEAMAVGVKAGLDAQALLDVINASTGRNSATMDKFPRAVLTRSFDYGGPLIAATKDLGLFLREAERMGVPASVTAEGARMWQTAAEQGDPQRDFTTIVKLVEQSAGIEIAYRSADGVKGSEHVQ